MNKAIIVFIVIMVQTTVTTIFNYHGIEKEVSLVWVCGSMIADVVAALVYSTYQK